MLCVFLGDDYVILWSFAQYEVYEELGPKRIGNIDLMTEVDGYERGMNIEAGLAFTLLIVDMYPEEGSEVTREITNSIFSF